MALFSWFKKAKPEEKEVTTTSETANSIAETESKTNQSTTVLTTETNSENRTNENVNSDVETNKESTTDTATETIANTKSVDTVNDTATVDSQPQNSTVTEEPFDETKPKMGFFKKLVKGLAKTGNFMGANLAAIFVGKKIDSALYEEIEDSLLSADVGWETTDKVISHLQSHVKATQLKDSEVLFTELKKSLTDIIAPYDQPLDVTTKKPFLILMVGVNGVGKTTTIGKITKKLQANGLSVILAAGDTFRAAAVEQLQEWGDRNNVPVIAQKSGADSASVIYDAFNSAIAKNIDVVIADTAGRLQNKSHLLEELRKIVRVIKKLDPSAPHEVMITLDATTGQNAINQVEEFDKAVNITGITITKLDGTGKGGVIFAICDKLKKPIRFIGVGEKIDDLQPFDHDQFIKALFENK